MSRFRKGQSGNPNGRPRSANGSRSRVARETERTSAFDLVIEKRLTLTQDGQPREVTIEEALQLKTYQDALAGKRLAQRAVLKMIVEREVALSQRRQRAATRSLAQPARKPLQVMKKDPDNAFDAMLLLGIATEEVPPQGPLEPDASGRRRRFLRLEPWAVQAAIDRRRRSGLTEQEIRNVELCTRDADSLLWPPSVLRSNDPT